jgi:hypothetical protein
MRQISNSRLRSHFLGWQCRVRQISARDHGGQPMPAMQPRVSLKSGHLVLAAMTVLLVPEDPAPSSAFFRFQVQKTNEPQRARESGLKYLAADFYQEPELFSDEMTAVFGAGSETAAALVRAREVLLDFEQFSQNFRMFAAVKRLAARSPAREASLWQARLFNPNIANDAIVLGFRPDWKNAAADPMP